MVISMGPMVVLGFGRMLLAIAPAPTWDWAQLVLCLPVMAYSGRRFFTGAVAEVRDRSLGMSTLVALGTASAFGFSAVALVAPGLLPAGTAHVYFESAAVIITLILVGKHLESRARGRTSSAIRRLMALQPDTALRLGPDGPVEVPTQDVRPGDRLLIRRGARVPVDGEVVDGRSWLDESMLTGESMPVARSVGEAVTGGTLNGSGSVDVEVAAVGAETTLARIIRMVESAQAAKAPIQRIVDQMHNDFDPCLIQYALQ